MASPLISRRTLEHVQKNHNPPFWSTSSVRFEISLLISTAMVIFGLMRNCFAMAMVAIIDDGNSTIPADEISYELHWTSSEQARIHTSYYVGAFLAVFTAEYASQRLGPKNLLSIGLLLNLIGSILTPVIAIFLRNYIFIVVTRTIMGFGFGFVIPCGSVLISKWFPMAEKSTAMAIFTTGNQIGIAASMLLTAKICQIPIFGGWPIAFVVYGVMGLVFLIVWHMRAADKPRHSKFITASELEFIHGGKARRRRAETVIRPTPYVKIIFNGCVVAICLCSFAQSFVLVAIVTYLPKYNQLAMKMSLTDNGIWSALPFVIQMITKMIFGIFADRVKQNRKADPTAVTKAANAVASFGCAVCILIVSVVPIEYTEAIQVALCFSMALFSAYVPGYNTSIVTVAPQFTAFISSYSQIYSQLGSTLAPIVIGSMTEKGTIEEWIYSFYMLAAVLVVTGLAFQISGHGRTEPWGETPSTINSTRVSTCTTSGEELGGARRSSVLEKHNILLRSESSANGGETRKKMSRVSYRDDEIVLPARLEDLENDVIYSIEEEEHEHDLPPASYL